MHSFCILKVLNTFEVLLVDDVTLLLVMVTVRMMRGSATELR